MNAIIIFSDIIDSSKYSAILGIDQYAENIITFQNTFREVANKYFHDNSLFSGSYVDSSAQGDECSVFIVPNRDADISEIVYLSVQYAFELKARLNLNLSDSASMKKMQIASGIHLGEVATILDDKVVYLPPEQIKNKRAKIQGYTINYAKRVESSSRHGKYSLIFLSKTASSYLSYKPVVLLHHEIDLKGISQKEDVYEVMSALCRDFKLDLSGDALDRFVAKYIDVNHLELIEHPWLKSFILSALESIRVKQPVESPIERKYWMKISDFIWQNHAEDDPILIFARALDCAYEEKYTRQLSLLKELIEKYPSFIFARREFVRAISAITDQNHISSELIYARDVANELTNKYPQALGNEEDRKEFLFAIDRIKTLLKDA